MRFVTHITGDITYFLPNFKYYCITLIFFIKNNSFTVKKCLRAINTFFIQNTKKKSGLITLTVENIRKYLKIETSNLPLHVK